MPQAIVRHGAGLRKAMIPSPPFPELLFRGILASCPPALYTGMAFPEADISREAMMTARVMRDGGHGETGPGCIAI